jgi:hypothetical protein
MYITERTRTENKKAPRHWLNPWHYKQSCCVCNMKLQFNFCLVCFFFGYHKILFHFKKAFNMMCIIIIISGSFPLKLIAKIIFSSIAWLISIWYFRIVLRTTDITQVPHLVIVTEKSDLETAVTILWRYFVTLFVRLLSHFQFQYFCFASYVKFLEYVCVNFCKNTELI